MAATETRRSVLLVTPGYPPNSIGGTELHVRGLVEALSGRYAMRVLSRDARGPEPEWEDPVLRAPRGPLMGSVDELVARSDPAFESAALEAVEDFRPGLVHLHHWIHLSNSLVELLARQRMPVVATLHDHYPICARTDLLRRGEVPCPGPEGGHACADCLPPPGAVFAGESKAHRVGRIAGSRLGLGRLTKRWVHARAQGVFRARLELLRGELRRASAVICPSAALKREIASVWPELEPQLTVLAHGVDTAWGRQVRRKPSVRVRFAYIGAVTPHKGIQTLLDAFAEVGPRGAELAIYGEIPDASFQRQVSARAARIGATMHGRYEPDHLPEIYSRVDVAVVPSICKENAPLAALEAQVGGAPVIASDLGGLPEVVEDETDGLLFRAGDARDLAEKIRAVAGDAQLLARLRANVRRPKSMPEYAREITSIYEAAISTITEERP
ncbi:MAG TPA: glycosyltransferase [Armatimonadota bacterium]|nr:glycosyltransferase [Armatimonadota bacterium]